MIERDNSNSAGQYPPYGMTNPHVSEMVSVQGGDCTANKTPRQRVQLPIGPRDHFISTGQSAIGNCPRQCRAVSPRSGRRNLAQGAARHERNPGYVVTPPSYETPEGGDGMAHLQFRRPLRGLPPFLRHTTQGSATLHPGLSSVAPPGHAHGAFVGIAQPLLRTGKSARLSSVNF